MAAPRRRRSPSPSSLWASKTASPCRSLLTVIVLARPRLSLIAPAATMAMGPLSVGCAAVGLAGWGPSASARKRTTAPRSRMSAAPGRASPSAASGASVSVASASATAVTLARSRASTVSVMTSPVSATRGRCAQVSVTSHAFHPGTHTHSRICSLWKWMQARACGGHRVARAEGADGVPLQGQETEASFSFIPLSSLCPFSRGTRKE